MPPGSFVRALLHFPSAARQTPVARRVFALSAAALFAIALPACAMIPFLSGKPEVRLTLSATADCNSCGRGSAYALYYRILQVTDASAMTGATLESLWDHEERLLGGALVVKSADDFIDPGKSKSVVIPRDPKAKAFVVVANFHCQAGGSCWYFVKPAKGGGAVKLELIADAYCLKAVKH